MKNKTKDKIPDWGSDEAIALFWDTHDIADYWDELELADDVKFVKPRKEVVSIRLEPIYLKQLKAVARKMGIDYTRLIRIWLVDKLHQSTKKAEAK